MINQTVPRLYRKNGEIVYIENGKIEVNEVDFEVLIVGTDINAYYMARCYHEAYGRKAKLIGKQEMAFYIM